MHHGRDSAGGCQDRDGVGVVIRVSMQELLKSGVCVVHGSRLRV